MEIWGLGEKHEWNKISMLKKSNGSMISGLPRRHIDNDADRTHGSRTQEILGKR